MSAPGPLPSVHRRPVGPGDEALLATLADDVIGAPLRAAGLDAAVVAGLVALQDLARRRSWAACHPSPGDHVLTLDGADVGRLWLGHEPQEHVVVDIAVLPAWRGRGVATATIADCIREAGHAGVPLRLAVAHDNPGARRLYERLGFVETARDEVRATLARAPAPGARGPARR